MSDICRDFYKLSERYSKTLKSPKSMSTVRVLPVDAAINEHKYGDKLLAWNSFKHHSYVNMIANYWVGYYLYHHVEEIHELRKIEEGERIEKAVRIFKETADKGNASGQLRYGMHLWKNEEYTEAFKYLKWSADADDTAAMYLVGKAYWNGGKGIEQNQDQGSEYLRRAALKNHDKAKKMCEENKITY